MNRLLAIAAVAEVVTGMALIVFPSLVGRLLLGAQFSGVAIIAGRIAGMALIGLGVACWPAGARALSGMLTYSAFVTCYLLYVAIDGECVGPLLWPVVVVHAALTLLLARAWFKAL
jgi:hypothetical protein